MVIFRRLDFGLERSDPQRILLHLAALSLLVETPTLSLVVRKVV